MKIYLSTVNPLTPLVTLLQDNSRNKSINSPKNNKKRFSSWAYLFFGELRGKAFFVVFW